jgi:predicted DNA-binding protein
MKNKKVMSIAIRPELHEELKKVSKRKGVSASEYVGDLVEQAVKINPDEDVVVIGKPVDEEVKPVMVSASENVKPIILNIPAALQTNPDGLEKWLHVQTAGILKKFCQSA